MVLALGVIAPIVLSDFDPPVAAHEPQQILWVGFFRGEAGDAVMGFVGGFDDLPPAQGVGVLVEAEDLSGLGQAEGGPVDGLTPDLALGDPPMVFIRRLSLRGE